MNTPLIDRSSTIPAYQQIATDIQRRISKNEWKVGEKINSELKLSSEYNVSRVTLRQALSLLQADDIIRKIQGKGIFVLRNPFENVQSMEFPSLNKTHNNGISSKNISIIKTTSVSDDILARLHIVSGSPVAYINRLFVKNDIIIGHNRIWIPYSFVPNIESGKLIDNSVSRTLLKSYNLDITTINNFCEALKLNAKNAKILNSTYDEPALKIESTHCLEDETPIEFSITIWLAKYTRLHFQATKDKNLHISE